MKILTFEGRLCENQWKTSNGQKNSRMEVVAVHINFLPKPNGSPEKREPAGHSIEHEDVTF